MMIKCLIKRKTQIKLRYSRDLNHLKVASVLLVILLEAPGKCIIAWTTDIRRSKTFMNKEDDAADVLLK